MNRARSSISCSTSAWFLGGTLTVVIWVTMSLSSRISGMVVLLLCAPPRQRPWRAASFADLRGSRRDRLGDRDRAARHVGMQALDHAAVELHHALVLVLGQVEGGDDALRLRDLLRARREGGVAWPDLARMDQGLAVEAHVARLGAFAGEAFRIAELVVDAVDDV